MEIQESDPNGESCHPIAVDVVKVVQQKERDGEDEQRCRQLMRSIGAVVVPTETERRSSRTLLDRTSSTPWLPRA